jgi:hypothetical protein
MAELLVQLQHQRLEHLLAVLGHGNAQIAGHLKQK